MKSTKYILLLCLVLFLGAIVACNKSGEKLFADESFLYAIWSPSGNIIAVRNTKTGSKRGNVKTILDSRSDIVYIPANGSEESVIVYDVLVNDIKVCPITPNYVAGSDGSAIKIWALENGNIISEFDTLSRHVGFDWGPRKDRMVTLEKTINAGVYILRIYNPLTGALIKSFDGFTTTHKNLYWRYKNDIAFVKNDKLALIKETDSSPTITDLEINYTYSYDKDKNFLYTFKDNYLQKINLSSFAVEQIEAINMDTVRVSEIFNDGTKYLLTRSYVKSILSSDFKWGIYIKTVGTESVIDII